MRAGLQRFARRWWAGAYGLPGRVLRALLAPISWIWARESERRARRFGGRGVVVPGIRVISVGNLAVGGTGKTPFAAWVARSLADAGERPALLLRGYGDDEVRLHRGWSPDIPVVVAADRVAGAREAAEAGAEVVVLDDGFQHHRLARSLDLVLLAVEDPFPGPVLPCGPYREGPHALARADGVVLTRRAGSVGDARAFADRVRAVPGVPPNAVIGCVHLEPRQFVPLASYGGDSPAAGEAGGGGDGPGRGAAEGVSSLEAPRAPALALTAVAKPDAFREDVAALMGTPTDVYAFADHHAFTAGDARRARRRAGERPIVVTEKDAVKLAPLRDELGEAWVLTQRLAWDWGEEDVLGLLRRPEVGR